MSIVLSEDDLKWAVTAGLISGDEESKLWPALQNRYYDEWKQYWVKFGYFLGGFLIVGSMGWFAHSAYQNSDSLALFYISLSYIITFGGFGSYFYHNSSYPPIIGGIFTLVSVSLCPLAVWALQRYFDWWLLTYRGFFEEFTLTVASSIAIYYIRWPFLALVVSSAYFSLLSPNITLYLFGVYPTDADFAKVSCVVSLAILAVGFLVKRLQNNSDPNGDFAFWIFFLGDLAFGSALTDLRTGIYETVFYFKVLYVVISLVHFAVAYLVSQNIFAFFGGIGIAYSIADYLINRNDYVFDGYYLSIQGSLLLLAVYYADKAGKSPIFVFWGYIFSVTNVFCGMNILYDNLADWFKIIYFVVAVGALVGFLYLPQRILLLYGILSVGRFVNFLVFDYFWNSFYLPFVVTAIGIGFIALALYLSRQHLQRKPFVIFSSIPAI